jgi:hypothetical protein
MDSCPRYLAIAVEDYEGPFSDAQTIGIAEVDFLKYTTEGLNDLWVYLEGEKVRGMGARLHLKVALNNENATEAGTRTRHLAEIVEQETGKKVRVRFLYLPFPPPLSIHLERDISGGTGARVHSERLINQNPSEVGRWTRLRGDRQGGNGKECELRCLAYCFLSCSCGSTWKLSMLVRCGLVYTARWG